MEGVKFDSEQEYIRPQEPEKQNGLLTLLQKWGLAKNEQQASYVLLGATAVAILIAVVSVFMVGHKAPKPPAPSLDGSTTY